MSDAVDLEDYTMRYEAPHIVYSDPDGWAGPRTFHTTIVYPDADELRAWVHAAKDAYNSWLGFPLA